MKLILYIALFIISMTAHAESVLETDDSFFKSAAPPYEDDDLDRVYKKNELTKSTERQEKIESKVKDEFQSIHQDIMSAHEAKIMDQKIVAENKRRQSAIMKRLNSSVGAVYACVAENVKSFQGTHATVIWMIAPSGAVIDSAIKSTDIVNADVQKCIREVASGLDFSLAKTNLLKKSLVKYTYKFKKKNKTISFKKATRRTAKQ